MSIKYLGDVLLICCAIFNIVNADCNININTLAEDSPVVLSAHSRNFISLHSSPKGFITIPNGTHLILLCPRANVHPNFFKNYAKNSELLVQCIDDNNFYTTQYNETFKFDFFSCALGIAPSLYFTNKTCYGPRDYSSSNPSNDGTSILVGYQTDYDFLTVYEVCFDKSITGPVYAAATISPDIQNRRFHFVKEWWYSDKELYRWVMLDAEYLCPSQATTFLRILYRNFFNDHDRCCFVKRRIIQSEDLTYVSQQIATFYDVNTIPICDLNNLVLVEQQIRELAISLDRPLNVWTGVYKKLQDNSAQSIIDKDIYIHYKHDDDKGVPVPKYIWKVVYEPHSEQVAVIITINDHKAIRENLKMLVPCPDICDQLSWLKLPARKDFKRGYTFCCTLDTFKNEFSYMLSPFPRKTSGILVGTISV